VGRLRLCAPVQERGCGIVEALLERAFNVYSINPKQFDRFRDRFMATGAKDDSRGADVLADSIRTDMGTFRMLTVAEPLIVEVREWSRIDEELKVRARPAHQPCAGSALALLSPDARAWRSR
jgi:hypothetical protein